MKPAKKLTALASILALAIGAAVAFSQSTIVAPQIVVPCKIISVHDGDTAKIEIHLQMNVRLLDCWAPEITGAEKEDGLKSLAKLKAMIDGKEGFVSIPLHDELGKSLTLGRVLARINIDGKDVSEQMVASGAATKTKKK